jgi:hypothetical protein
MQKELLVHVRAQREQAINCGFSIGWAITERERAAITSWTEMLRNVIGEGSETHQVVTCLSEFNSIPRSLAMI